MQEIHPEKYEHILVDSIIASPYQMRTQFGGPEDDEFDASIAKDGVHSPIQVRKNGKPGTFELVFGERRWRAAKKAGHKDIPAIVVALNDDQVIERLVVENLQRRNLHPLEEAEGYRTLMDTYGYTMEKLIAKTGKSKAHLYGRVKLARDLVPFAKKEVQRGKLQIANAELIARQDPKVQEQLTKEALGIKLDHAARERLAAIGVAHELVSTDGKDVHNYDSERQPLSYDALRALIRQRYSTRLALAKFDPQDATLTNAGACTTCEFRSGNQPELPGMATVKSDDMCTRPLCFEEKSKAAWKQQADAAKARGVEVVEPVNAKKNVFDWDGVAVKSTSPYVELDTMLPSDLAKSPGSKDTFGRLLGKHASEIPRVLVQDGSGAPRELLSREAAVKKLRELGKIDKPKKPSRTSASSEPIDPEAERKRMEKERDQEILIEETVKRCLAITAEAAADIGKKELALWKWIVRCVVDTGGGGDDDVMLARRGCKNSDALCDLVEKAKTVAEARSIAVEYLVMNECGAKTRPWASSSTKERFAEAGRLFGFDWQKQFDAAKTVIKQAQHVEAAIDAKIEAAKKPGAKAKPAKKKGKR